MLFGDISNVDRKSGVLRLVNCGAMATKLARTSKDVDLAPQYKYMGSKQGVTTVFCCKEGDVTLARLVRIQGKYSMFLTSGTAQYRSKECFKEAKDLWPHAFIHLNADPGRFIQEARSNHLHLVYGHFKEELINLCGMLQINVICP